MTVVTLTPDFLAWCEVRGFKVNHLTSDPEWWALIVMYDHEREIDLWPLKNAEQAQP